MPLIAVEGIDGAGKSTLCKGLYRELSEEYPVILTYEPTDGVYGKKLRERIKEGNISPQEEFELFMLDREDHVRNVINPALSQGKLVITDRYFLSSCAYQGARGLNYRRLCEENLKFPQPDLVLLLDLPPEVALSRKSFKEEHFENLYFLKKVREIYLEVVKNHRHLIIDARRPAEEVLKDALEEIRKCLKG